jgi:hypothetical protein
MLLSLHDWDSAAVFPAELLLDQLASDGVLLSQSAILTALQILAAGLKLSVRLMVVVGRSSRSAHPLWQQQPLAQPVGGCCCLPVD